MKNPLIILWLALASFNASAIELTPAQKTALKADVLVQPAVSQCLAGGDYSCIADFYNSINAGGQKCWKTSFSNAELLGAIDWNEYISRSAPERDALNRMFSVGSVDASKSNVRAGFSNIFSGTAQRSVDQRAALTAASQRAMTYFETVFATGPVSGTYTCVLEGTVDFLTIRDAVQN